MQPLRNWPDPFFLASSIFLCTCRYTIWGFNPSETDQTFLFHLTSSLVSVVALHQEGLRNNLRAWILPIYKCVPLGSPRVAHLHKHRWRAQIHIQVFLLMWSDNSNIALIIQVLTLDSSYILYLTWSLWSGTISHPLSVCTPSSGMSRAIWSPANVIGVAMSYSCWNCRYFLFTAWNTNTLP